MIAGEKPYLTRGFFLSNVVIVNFFLFFLGGKRENAMFGRREEGVDDLKRNSTKGKARNPKNIKIDQINQNPIKIEKKNHMHSARKKNRANTEAFQT